MTAPIVAALAKQAPALISAANSQLGGPTAEAAKSALLGIARTGDRPEILDALKAVQLDKIAEKGRDSIAALLRAQGS
jgi:hypothetical protein